MKARSSSTPVPYWRSRVSPGRSATSASRVPVRRLNRVDLPTLGRPTRTRVGSLSLVMGRLSVKRVQQERRAARRSEEHPSELLSLLRISHAVLCLKQIHSLFISTNQQISIHCTPTFTLQHLHIAYTYI